MGVGTLRDDLLSLPDVEQAEIDDDSATPSAVRVRLAQGADPAATGEEIRRILALHGLRQENDVAPGSTGSAATSSIDPETEDSRESEDAPLARESEVSASFPRRGEDLDWVSVAEGRNGVTVTAGSASDEVSAVAAGSSVAAVDQAVVSAVAELAGAVSIPLICSLDERDLAATPVVTVVLEENGRRLVGSAVVEGGRAYAVGRAVWTALSAR